MIANVIDDAMNGGSPSANGAVPELPAGYRADQANPHIWRPNQEPGRYDTLFQTVRHMVDPELRTLNDHVRSGYYSSTILRTLAHRYYHHTQWQIRSESSMMNWRRLEYLKEKAWLEALLTGLKVASDPADVAQLGEEERRKLRETAITYPASVLGNDPTRPLTTVIPITLGEAWDRVDEISLLLRSLAQRIRRAQALGIYYDVGPLLSYWQTDYHKRGDLDPTLGPSFMARLNEIIDITSSSIWRQQAQHINAHTSADDAKSAEDADPGQQPKRSLFGKIIKR